MQDSEKNCATDFWSTNADYTTEWLNTIAALGGDPKGFRRAMKHMESSTAIVHGKVTPCTAVPRFFDGTTQALMKHAATTMHDILQKIVNRYILDADYRHLFYFDPRLEELALLPCGHDALVPFARYDIFLDENTGDFTFCELNADGSSGMNEDREIARAIRKTEVLSAFTQRYQVEENELFASWVDTFMSIYARSGHMPERPHVALCDYLDRATLGEFKEYQAEFERREIRCSICDVRNLQLRDGALRTATGAPIDAIWRRCVTNDILEFWNESQEFLEGVRQKLVVLIGGFSGHIIHDKQIFRVLQMPETKAFLDEAENEFVSKHVPFTTFLDEQFINLKDIREHKDLWVIKPTDHYGADKVYLGIEESAKHWSELIDRFANNKAGYLFLAQRFQRPFRTLTIRLADALDEHSTNSLIPASYANLSGLYMYDGAFKGAFSRLGPGEIVTGLAGGLTAATLWVDCKKP